MQNQKVVEHVSQESALQRRTLAVMLQALADPALTRLKADDIAHAVLQCLHEIMATDNVAILLLTEDHTALRVHMALGLEEAVARDVYVPVGHGFAGLIVTQGLPFIVRDTSKIEIVTPVLSEQLHSLLGVPLIVHRQVIGVIHVGMKLEYNFTDADVVLLQHVADYLAQAFERTLLIEVEQHEFEELIEAQLNAVVELVDAQLHMGIEQVEAQKYVAGELLAAQYRGAKELVAAQLRIAVELVETQLHTAVKLMEAQLPTAKELVGAQERTAVDLMGTQLRTALEKVRMQKYMAGELVDAQLPTAVEQVELQKRKAVEQVELQKRKAVEQVRAQEHIAGELLDAQEHIAGELVDMQEYAATELSDVQLHIAGELVDEQLPTAIEQVELQKRKAIEKLSLQKHMAVELVDAQEHIAVELVSAQEHAATELLDVQLHIAGELVDAQEQVAGELVDAQEQVAGELVDAQFPTAIELMGAQQRVAIDLMEVQQHTAGELMGAEQYTAAELIEAQQHVAIELLNAQHRVAVDLLEAQQRVAVELVEEQQRMAEKLAKEQKAMRVKAFERINDLATIFNAITDGIIVYDEQENIIRSNKAANYLLGIETSSATQNTNALPSWRTMYQLRDAHGYPFSHEHLPLKRLLHGERLTAKQSVTVDLHTLDDRDVQLSVTGAPLYNQQGSLCGAVCVLRDVTTRKHMERRVEILDVLLQMVELLVTSSAQKEREVIQDDFALAINQIESNILVLAQRLLSCSHAIIIGIDRSTCVLSPLALAGFSLEEEQRLRTSFIDAHLSLFIGDPNKVALLEKQERLPFDITQSPLLQPLLPLSFSKNCHLVPIHVDHHLIGLLYIVFPESAAQLNVGSVALITAISKLCALALQYEQQTTEQDQLIAAKVFLNEQLEEVNKLQSDFISIVSHEFRTSLTIIEGFSDLLRSEDYSSEEVKDTANDIYTDALRLHRMVTDLLDMEQMKKGKMQLHLLWVDMNTLLTTLAKHMELVSTRHTLHLSLAEKLPLLEGDPDKLVQVFTNVLSNAVKYFPQGGDILIESKIEGDAVHISIQDHGAGIAPEFLENIFTAYYRTNSASTRYIQGTGLGLSLAHEIVQLHGGKIWAESTLGHGSTFHITLPLQRAIVGAGV